MPLEELYIWYHLRVWHHLQVAVTLTCTDSRDGHRLVSFLVTCLHDVTDQALDHVGFALSIHVQNGLAGELTRLGLKQPSSGHMG